MTIRPALWNQISSSAGLVCLAMTLLLLPAGVRSVRASDGADGLISEDPTLVPSESMISEKPPVAPVSPAGDAGTEVRTGVVVLNTRGYNYGQVPGQLDPAAVDLESKTH